MEATGTWICMFVKNVIIFQIWLFLWKCVCVCVFVCVSVLPSQPEPPQCVCWHEQHKHFVVALVMFFSSYLRLTWMTRSNVCKSSTHICLPSHNTMFLFSNRLINGMEEQIASGGLQLHWRWCQWMKNKKNNVCYTEICDPSHHVTTKSLCFTFSAFASSTVSQRISVLGSWLESLISDL